MIRVRDYKLRSFGYVIRVQDYKLRSLSTCSESTLRAVGGHSIVEKGHHMKTENKTTIKPGLKTRERDRERERHTHTHPHTKRERHTKESSMPITGNLQARSPRNLQVGKNLTLECKERKKEMIYRPDEDGIRLVSFPLLLLSLLFLLPWVGAGGDRKRRIVE